MTPFVPLAMFGFPLATLLLFAVIANKRHAMLLAVIAGWLLLPQYIFDVPGPLKWSRGNAVSFSVLLAIVLFDSKRLFSFRRTWLDLPALVVCIWPGASSFANHLGVPDAATSMMESTMMYGAPYLFGRIYIVDLPAVYDLLRAIILGAIFYVPLCLFELRFSPMLHYRLYGFFQHTWAQMVRGGGYRPIIFMQHALAVAMWMSVGTICAFALWRSSPKARVLNTAIGFWVLVLAFITVECKTAGAIVLGLVGSLAIYFTRAFPPKWLLIGLLLVSPAYMFARAGHILTADRISRTLETVFPDNRVESAQDRLQQEEIMSERSFNSPIFGFGPWGGFFFEQSGDDESSALGHVDSMWIITLGKYGYVGLLAATLLYLLPATIFALRIERFPILHVKLLLPLAVISGLVMIDNLSNYMPNPLFVMIPGALLTLVQYPQRYGRQLATARIITSSMNGKVVSNASLNRSL